MSALKNERKQMNLKRMLSAVLAVLFLLAAFAGCADIKRDEASLDSYSSSSKTTPGGLGDVNGDGKINPSDYNLVARHYMGTYMLTAAQFERADINGTKVIEPLDYLLIARHYMGTYVITGIVSGGISGDTSGDTSSDASDDTSSDTSDNDEPIVEIPTTESSIPQRLYVADGAEIYTRLYSMYMSDADSVKIRTEAEKLMQFMRSAEDTDLKIGGADYDGKIYTTGDYVVDTDDEFKAAVNSATSGDVIFIPSGATIDMADLYTTEKFISTLAAGVILASDRGINEGGILKLSHPSAELLACSSNTTITGLNLMGAVSPSGYKDASNVDYAILARGINVKISNCEFVGFAKAVATVSGGRAAVDNCYFHDNETAVSERGEISLTACAFYNNETDYEINGNAADIGSENIVLEARTVEELDIERVVPDIVTATFVADSYEVYSLLEEIVAGDASEEKLCEVLSVHSGATNYYKYKDKLTVVEDGVSYGIDDDGTPLGGGAGYDEIYTTGDVTVTTVAELRNALLSSKSGDVIFIPGDVVMDVTNQRFTVPTGVIVASDRGRVLPDGSISTGALLYATVRQSASTAIFYLSRNSVFTGISLIGADTQRHMTHHARGLSNGSYTSYYYSLALTRGISISSSDGAEVSNCEIAGFTEAGVFLANSHDVKVHHCYIHHNQRNGYGYGVVLYGETYVEVYRNLFNFDRHSVAANGVANQGYQAHNNVHMGTAIYHIFDMHGGGDRGDGTTIAGERIDMYNNALLCDKLPYKKRGTPEEYSKFTYNVVLYPEAYYERTYLYGTKFICENNYWGVATLDRDYNFEGGTKFTITTNGNIVKYQGMESIDSVGYSLRYKCYLVFSPSEDGDGYYVSEYGNNLDNGSINGINATVLIPEGGFVLTFGHNSSTAKSLYDAIAARHGIIYNTGKGLFGDYIAEVNGNTITVTQSIDY